NHNWSLAGNWKENLVPDPNDDLVFPDDALTFASNNDLPEGTPFHTIVFFGRQGGYLLRGSGVVLTAGISGTGGSNSVELSFIRLGAAQRFDAEQSSLTVSSAILLQGFVLTLDGGTDSLGSPLTDVLSGPVSGDGGITKQGTANWRLSNGDTV